MANIFSVDNPFFRFMSKVCDVFLLSVLWLICSLPVITAGAATAALNSVSLKMVRNEESYILRSYFKAFAKLFKNATKIWLLSLAAALVLAGDLMFFYRMGNWPGTLGAGAAFLGLLILGLILTLIFHDLAWYKKGAKATMIHSFKAAIAFLPYSAALLIMFAAMAYGIYVSVELMVFFTLFGAGLFAYVSACLWRRVFDKLENRQHKVVKI